MSKRHKKTLNSIFTQPISGNIQWRAVLLNDRVAVFHRPHPGPNMDKGAVRDLQRFLESARIMPRLNTKVILELSSLIPR